MGVFSLHAMKPTTSLTICVLCLLITQLRYCESFNTKRGYRDPDDPRNLFAAMYGGVYKRAGDAGTDRYQPEMTPDQFDYLRALVSKRGLRDPDDPRNLFHSIYGGVWK